MWRGRSPRWSGVIAINLLPHEHWLLWKRQRASIISSRHCDWIAIWRAVFPFLSRDVSEPKRQLLSKLDILESWMSGSAQARDKSLLPRLSSFSVPGGKFGIRLSVTLGLRDVAWSGCALLTHVGDLGREELGVSGIVGAVRLPQLEPSLLAIIELTSIVERWLSVDLSILLFIVYCFKEQ